jgi:hypothetical protein
MLFKEVVAIYSEIRMKPLNILYAQRVDLLIISECGIYRYQ